MNVRVTLIGLAGGGLLATALLQAAAAVADSADPAPSATGADAFTIGSYTFDPYTVTNTGTDVEGWTTVLQLSSAPPLLQLGGGTALGLPLAPQNFDVYNSGGGAVGSIRGDETVMNLLGMTNTEFTVGSVTPVADGSASDLPAKGSVYDVFNLGNGVENVYTATSGSSGTVTDTLVTSHGNINLDLLLGNINAAQQLQPGDAFSGLADPTVAKDAFAIGGYALDPVSGTGTSATEGWTPVDATASAPPLLSIGGASLFDPTNAGNDLATQVFDVYTGSGSSATEVGNITTGEDVTNLLGMTNTELVVTSTHTVASGASASDLPATGTVYDVFNLGDGIENVYTALPGSSGTITDYNVTDTLVTPLGQLNLSFLFSGVDAADPLQPGDAFTGLADTAIGKDAFTIGSTTFDPFVTSSSGAVSEGFAPVYQTIGSPPLLNIGGGTPSLPLFGQYLTLPLATQHFDVYSGATEIGSVKTYEDVMNLLGMTNTEFSVQSATAAASDTSSQAAALPATGTVYDVFNLGNGIENVYTALPGTGGTVTDYLMTPLGNIDLSSLFSGIDAATPLNPGDAFTSGLDVVAAASAIDPLSFLGL